MGPKTRKDRRHVPKEGGLAPLAASRRPPGRLPPSGSVHSRSLTTGSLSTFTVSSGTLHTASLVMAAAPRALVCDELSGTRNELHFLFPSLHQSERPHSESAVPFGPFQGPFFSPARKTRMPWTVGTAAEGENEATVPAHLKRARCLHSFIKL